VPARRTSGPFPPCPKAVGGIPELRGNGTTTPRGPQARPGPAILIMDYHLVELFRKGEVREELFLIEVFIVKVFVIIEVFFIRRNHAITS